jgi:hypothetical protein
MPSSATITSFYVFAAGTPAAASEVTANFNTFRGHLISIDPNTATASATKTYDLGSAEHRWGGVYSQALDISITTTATMLLQGLSSGGISFRKDGTEIFSIVDNGFKDANATPSGLTTSAALGSVAAPAAALNATITTSGAIAGTTCTIVTAGRRVAVGLLIGSTAAPSFIEVGRTTSGGGAQIYWALSVVRDGTVLPPLIARSEIVGRTYQYPPSAFFMIDVPAAGTHTYALQLTTITSNSYIFPSNCRLVAYEF